MKRRILVVEDSPTQAELLRLLLEGAGYQVDLAGNGREGLERVQSSPPDLIISDVVMPEMDGYAFCQAVKSAERTRRIPIVLLTQRNTPQDILWGLTRGADNFITKPFDDEYLLERVKRIFEHLELRRKGQLEMDVTLRVGEREIVINADKQQIVELLFATFEDVCKLNQMLLDAERKLEDYALHLEAKVQERTEALRETRDYLDNLLNYANAPVIVWDAQFRVTRFNRAFERLTGRNAKEVIGQGLDLLFPEDKRQTSLDYIRSTTGERWETVEIAIQHVDGTVRTLLWNSATLYAADGKTVLATIAQGHDITERKRAEEALRRSTERLKILHEIDRAILAAQSPQEIAETALHHIRRLVSCQRAGIALFDMESRVATLLAVDVEGESHLGTGSRFPLDEFPFTENLREGKADIVEDLRGLPRPPSMAKTLAAEGIRTFMCVPLVTRGELIGSLNVGAATPSAFTSEDREVVREVADQLVIAIQQARLHATAVRRGEELAALLQANEALTSSLNLNQILQAIVQHAATISGVPIVRLFLLEADAQILRCRVAVGFPLDVELDLAIPMGVSLSGHVAVTGRPLAVADTRGDPRVHYPQHIEPYGVVSYLGLPVKFQEQLFGVLVFNTPTPRTYSEAEISFLAAFAHHAAITIQNARLYETIQRHAAELEARVEERTRDLETANQQLQDASRHKSEFLANMSHELRTPLNSIIGFAELLQGQGIGPLTERQARYLTHIWNGGKHLLQLINDILDLSKVEAGKFVLQPEALPVAATLEDILVIARGLANKKAQEVQADIASDLPPLNADPVRFKQILFNLLSNAVKFTPEHGTITLAARRLGGEDARTLSGLPASRPPSVPAEAWLEIRVTDTGIGIKTEDLPRLFQEFVQLETTQAQKHEGTGLGLALTKRLVELHGGRIWVESEGESRGSTFTVLLPFSGPGAPAEALAGARSS
jgi:PAS domain S-box-containing protein